MKNPNIENSNKIFVGGLACTTTLQSLKEYFEQFGPVKDCVLMIEKETGRSRGFGFVIMKHIYDTYKIFNIPIHVLDDKQIDCKKAVPKDKVAPQNKSKKRVQSQSKGISNESIPILNNIALEPAIISSENKMMMPFCAPLMTSQCLTAPLKIKAQAREKIMNKLQTKSNSYFPIHQGGVQLRPSNVGERVQWRPVLGKVDTPFDPSLWIPTNQPARYSVGAKIVKPTAPSNDSFDEKQFSYNSKKIFVGGLPHGLTESDFKIYFSQFGEIEDSVVMHDRNTGKPRGFGFVTYSDERSLDLVMKHKLQHKLNGKWIECKRATPKTGAALNSNPYCDYEVLKSTAFYPGVQEGQINNIMTSNCDGLTRKQSSENLMLHQKWDNSCNESQTTSSNTFGVKAKKSLNTKLPNELGTTMIAGDYKSSGRFTVGEKRNFECLSDHQVTENQWRYFTTFLEEDDTKPILEKVEKLNNEEDKINTYGGVFEDFNKSENGSDWNISCSDPFDIKDTGFPQPLPSSDVGSIFNKYGSGYVGKCPPNKAEVPHLPDIPEDEIDNPFTMMIKNDLINLVYEDNEGENKQKNKVSHPYKFKDENLLYPNTNNGYMKSVSMPHYSQSQWENQNLSALDNPFSVCESADSESGSGKGKYSKTNNPYLDCTQ